ncbi:MAG: Amuc_1100 family pilus-like protein, partial [Kiritimatiellae bacterium]|nr:Amuc_1100 family pilus-like protein [Kiritimatiellia bacterium]
MIRKHLSLVIGGVVFLVLAAVLGWLLFANLQKYGEAAGERDTASQKLRRLVKREPFPSRENVEAVRQQMESFTAYLGTLSEKMREGQMPEEQADYSQFAGLYEDMLSRMDREARAKNVSVPPNFAFGFQYYAAGNLPMADETPHLVLQLRTVEQLCSILFESGISTLLSVERPVFEEAALNEARNANEENEGGRRRRRMEENAAAEAAPTGLYADPDGLFTREHYVFAFRAKDTALAKVLDRLSSGQPYAVVTKLDVSNTAKPLTAKPNAEGGDKEAGVRTGTAGAATAARGSSDGTEAE